MMKRFTYALFVFFFFHISSNAQSSWDSDLIPDSLKEDANAVIRHSSSQYIRTGLSTYEKSIHYVVTILNESGESASELRIYYDRNSSVDDISIRLYNQQGESIRKVKSKEVADYAYSNSYTLFTDSRIKHYTPAYSHYPYTVEYNYTTKHKSVVSFSDWYPTDWFDTAVEFAELSYSTPVDFDLKYQAFNTEFEYSSTSDEKTIHHVWQAKNLQAIPNESYTLSYQQLLPVVMLSPVQISFEGYEGNFETWQSMGQWVAQLIQGRDQLPQERLAEITNLTDTITTPKLKVKALYEYMQAKTRYVNVALGIGGFQPLTAMEVDEKGYGDCKALSNYMKSLLQGIGIHSYYTVIGNGKYREIKYPDYSSLNQTNHIILCVPLEKDTIWLECTNQNYPFGYIGASNANRFGLLIDEQGGTLVKTNNYLPSENTRNSTIAVVLQETGEARFNSQTSFKNYLFESVFALVHSSAEEQKKMLLKAFSIDGLSFTNLEIANPEKSLPLATVSMEGTISRYSQKAGSRLLVKPHFLFENLFPSRLDQDRKASFFLANGYTTNDTIQFEIPTDYTIEFTPKDLTLESTLGNYSLSYEVTEENKLRIIRSTFIKPGNYEPALFPEIDLFLRTCSGKEEDKVVLKKI